MPEIVPTLYDASEVPMVAINNPMSLDTRFLYEEEVSKGLYADLRRGK